MTAILQIHFAPNMQVHWPQSDSSSSVVQNSPATNEEEVISSLTVNLQKPNRRNKVTAVLILIVVQTLACAELVVSAST